jgi:hypothetical protein
MAIYSPTSPYYSTDQSKGYLDIISFRDLSIEFDDILFTITKNYEYRPDLLAFDLYNDVTLWWVFAVRNKAIIQDPIFDMEAGVEIYLPKLTTINKIIGI